MGERISDSCVRPVVTFSVYLSPLPYTHGPYDHILSIKENHTGKNSKPIPATAAYLSYLLVRPSFASSDRNLLCVRRHRADTAEITCACRPLRPLPAPKSLCLGGDGRVWKGPVPYFLQPSPYPCHKNKGFLRDFYGYRRAAPDGNEMGPSTPKNIRIYGILGIFLGVSWPGIKIILLHGFLCRGRDRGA